MVWVQVTCAYYTGTLAGPTQVAPGVAALQDTCVILAAINLGHDVVTVCRTKVGGGGGGNSTWVAEHPTDHLSSGKAP